VPVALIESLNSPVILSFSIVDEAKYEIPEAVKELVVWRFAVVIPVAEAVAREV
jgi:hypothetical protein